MAISHFPILLAESIAEKNSSRNFLENAKKGLFMQNKRDTILLSSIPEISFMSSRIDWKIVTFKDRS